MENIGADSVLSIGDSFAYGLRMLVFGLGTVFAVLILLWGILELFKLFFHTIPNRRKKTPAQVKEVTENVTSDAEEDPSDAKRLVAAITAAICAYRSSNGENGSFRVVSFKKR